MTVRTAAATAPAADRVQAAVNDAAKHLYDAETALHIARQTGVGSWISAADDRLHEAVAGHLAAVDALDGRNRAVPLACPCAPLACGRASPGQLAADPLATTRTPTCSPPRATAPRPDPR